MNKENQLIAPVNFTDDELAEINTVNAAGYGIDEEVLEEAEYQLNNTNED